MSTWRSKTLLKEEWSAFHKLSSERHGKPLCLIVSIVGNFCLDPVHELPRPMTLVGDFLDFGIEECPFGGFDYMLE